MNLDRARKEIEQDLATNPDVPHDERFDDVLALLAELAARETPSNDVVELLHAGAELATTESFARTRAERVRRAAAGRPTPEPVQTLLARERRKARLSVDDAARLLGVPAQVLDQLESGRGLARILKIPPQQVRALTERLGIAYQQFLLSLGGSLPRPTGFVYAYRPRDASGEPAATQDADTSTFVSWVTEYASAK